MAKTPSKDRAQELGLSKEQLIDMLTRMWEIRAFEEKVAYFFSRGMVHGTTHLCVGQEASAVGSIGVLNNKDLITSTHRGHGHTIAKGIDLGKMMAELLGRENGYCKGKGGSMHIVDLTRGNLGANGIVGGGIPIAVGAALSLKMRNQDQVVICYFGDGALNEGSFHEAVNMAAVWDLPVIFICEDNQYGMSMSRHKSIKLKDLSDRAKAYGIPGETVDGNDLFAVYEATKRAKDHVRKNGPYLLINETYRYMGHSKSDANKYRTKEEIAEWKKKDPIQRVQTFLIDHKYTTQTEIEAIEAKAREAIEEAVKFAESSPQPRLETIADDVYA
jgi:pyruvate dehydrogenase E1 component alpha subunit